MLEGSIMEYVKWFIGLVSLYFVTMMVVLMFQMNELNTFQQEVNYQIERHGGLTEDAMAELNEFAISRYGGGLVTSNEVGAPCIDGTPADTPSSGFYLHELKVDESIDSDYEYILYKRPNSEKARYGTTIRYILSRHVGRFGEGRSFINLSIIGESASRVRGTASAD